MAIKYVVDTHALLWYLEGNPKLGNAAKAVLSDPASELVLPLIALAEAVFTVEKARLKFLRSRTCLRMSRATREWKFIRSTLIFCVKASV